MVSKLSKLHMAWCGPQIACHILRAACTASSPPQPQHGRLAATPTKQPPGTGPAQQEVQTLITLLPRQASRLLYAVMRFRPTLRRGAAEVPSSR